MNYEVWSIYFIGCWRPFWRSDLSKVNLCSCRSLTCQASLWIMIMFFAILTRLKIKILIFHMANLITMLGFESLKFLWKRSKWTWVVLKISNTQKLNWFEVVQNIKRHFIFISKTDSLLLFNDFFRTFDDGFAKCK